MKERKPAKKKQNKSFETSDDFINAAIEEEDSGDRWISTDLAKGLRFYQRAFDLYIKGIDQGDSALRNDALYNIARMQFVIYNKVIKPGHWPDLCDKFQGAIHSIVMEDIGKIVENHRQLLTSMGNGSMENMGIDVLFNYAQVLTEAGEDQERLDWLIEARGVFQHVLNRQKEEFKAIVNEEGKEGEEKEKDEENMEESDSESPEPGPISNPAPKYATQIETVTPAVLLDTLVAIIECIGSVIDTLDETEQTAELYEENRQFAQDIIVQLEELLQISKGLSANLQIEQSSVDEALIAIASFRSSVIQYGESEPLKVLKELEQLWKSDQLNHIVTKQRYLAEASSFVEFAEKYDTHSWNGFSDAAKTMQQGVQLIGRTPDLGQMYLMWGDIEYQRSKCEIDAAIKNRNLLLKNSATLYGNVVSLQSLSSDVVPLKREASIKMAIVQGAAAPPIPSYLRNQLVDLGMIDQKE